MEERDKENPKSENIGDVEVDMSSEEKVSSYKGKSLY